MKEKKTVDELRTILMDEVAKHPDWSRIEGVAITRSFAIEPGGPNRKVGFVCDGALIAPAAAFLFAKELGNRYDVDGESYVSERARCGLTGWPPRQRRRSCMGLPTSVSGMLLQDGRDCSTSEKEMSERGRLGVT